MVTTPTLRSGSTVLGYDRRTGQPIDVMTVDPGTDPEASMSTSDRAGWTVERGVEAVAGCVVFHAPPSSEGSANHLVMALDK